MAEITTCPICNSELPAGAHSCPRCGFKLAGNTQQFNQVGGNTQSFTPVSVADAVPAVEQFADPALRVIKGPSAGDVFYLDRPTITLGRDPHCDIFLNDMTVSRKHAQITIAPGRVELTDLGSLNGTWVDGRICDDAVLRDGSVVQIGTFTMMLQENPAR